MADIQLRFHKDMLALTSPIAPILQQQGFNANENLALSYILEEDSMREAYRMACASMAPCLVAETSAFTPARLAHVNASDKLEDLARAALLLAGTFKPQHILVDIGECGLPLDPESKNSLLEHRRQYECVGRAFESVCGGRVESGKSAESSKSASSDNFGATLTSACSMDAFFLSGFQNTTALKCALMGLSMVSSKPIFASINVNENNSFLHEALNVMAEYGASVLGVQTSAPISCACEMVQYAKSQYNLPILVQLEVQTSAKAKNANACSSAYTHPQDMFDAAPSLHRAGVQFLRAAGNATPAFASALAASCAGVDVFAGA